eukprot:scaffold270607_cov36-Tisochrysis_lutea.AAC.5
MPARVGGRNGGGLQKAPIDSPRAVVRAGASVSASFSEVGPRVLAPYDGQKRVPLDRFENRTNWICYDSMR